MILASLMLGASALFWLRCSRVCTVSGYKAESNVAAVIAVAHVVAMLALLW